MRNQKLTTVWAVFAVTVSLISQNHRPAEADLITSFGEFCANAVERTVLGIGNTIIELPGNIYNKVVSTGEFLWDLGQPGHRLFGGSTVNNYNGGSSYNIEYSKITGPLNLMNSKLDGVNSKLESILNNEKAMNQHLQSIDSKLNVMNHSLSMTQKGIQTIIQQNTLTLVNQQKISRDNLLNSKTLELTQALRTDKTSLDQFFSNQISQLNSLSDRKTFNALMGTYANSLRVSLLTLEDPAVQKKYSLSERTALLESAKHFLSETKKIKNSFSTSIEIQTLLHSTEEYVQQAQATLLKEQKLLIAKNQTDFNADVSSSGIGSSGKKTSSLEEVLQKASKKDPAATAVIQQWLQDASSIQSAEQASQINLKIDALKLSDKDKYSLYAAASKKLQNLNQANTLAQAETENLLNSFKPRHEKDTCDLLKHKVLNQLHPTFIKLQSRLTYYRLGWAALSLKNANSDELRPFESMILDSAQKLKNSGFAKESENLLQLDPTQLSAVLTHVRSVLVQSNSKNKNSAFILDLTDIGFANYVSSINSQIGAETVNMIGQFDNAFNPQTGQGQVLMSKASLEKKITSILDALNTLTVAANQQLADAKCTTAVVESGSASSEGSASSSIETCNAPSAEVISQQGFTSWLNEFVEADDFKYISTPTMTYSQKGADQEVAALKTKPAPLVPQYVQKEVTVVTYYSRASIKDPWVKWNTTEAEYAKWHSEHPEAFKKTSEKKTVKVPALQTLNK